VYVDGYSFYQRCLMFIAISEELGKTNSSTCESVADKLLILVTSMPSAFITKPTSDLKEV